MTDPETADAVYIEPLSIENEIMPETYMNI